MKISRITAKTGQLASKGVKVVASAGRRVAQSSAQLLEWLKLQIKGLIDALKDGSLLAYLREKIGQMFGRSVDELDNIGKNLNSVRLNQLNLEEWKKAISKLGGRVRDYSESREIMKYFKMNNSGAAFDGRTKPPTIWIRSDEVSDLQLFHESMHFEDFLRRGSQKYMNRGEPRSILPFGNKPQVPKRDQVISKYIKEKYVLDKILEEQAAWIKKYRIGRFTESEIAFSKLYFQDFIDDCLSYGIDLSKITLKQ